MNRKIHVTQILILMAMLLAPIGVNAHPQPTSSFDGSDEHVDNVTPQSGPRQERPGFMAYNVLRPVVYLTFDDGPSRYTGAILDILNKYNVKGTFFVLGSLAQRDPGMITNLWDSGMGIGNHTWDHYNMVTQSYERREADMRATDAEFQRILGTSSGCYRPPYGATSDAVRTHMAQLGLTEWKWSVDTQDWTRPGIGAIYRRLSSAVDGSIILMHDGGGHRTQTIAALEQWLAANATRFEFRNLPGCAEKFPMTGDGSGGSNPFSERSCPMANAIEEYDYSHETQHVVGRLYLASFGRLPEEDGWKYWIDQCTRGNSIEWVASHFSDCDEFKQRYGDNVSNARFIELLYENALERTPDQNGQEYWVALLDSGEWDRGEVLRFFSDSSENQNNWANRGAPTPAQQ